MTSQRLLIRTDANPEIGWGHLMRCLAVAEAWRDGGNEARFLCQDSSAAAVEAVRKRGFSVLGRGLKAGSVEDADELKAAAIRFRPDWLLLDHYRFDRTFFDRLNETEVAFSAVARYQDSSSSIRPWRCIAAFDDGYGERELPVDLVINGNAHAALGGLEYRQTATLLGPRFLALRKEFAAARSVDDREAIVRQIEEREDSSAAPRSRQVLITLGASDASDRLRGLLPELRGALEDVDRLQGLSAEPKNESWKFLVVLGDVADEVQGRVYVAMQDLGIPGECVCRVDDMLSLYRKTDVAVSAGGSTLYELACLGIPTLAMILAENQRPSLEALVSLGIVKTSCRVNGLREETTHQASTHQASTQREATNAAFSLRASLTTLMLDERERSRLRSRSLQLVDGRGAQRIAKRLAIEPIELRPATYEDGEALLALRNDPLVRGQSLNRESVDRDQHFRWLSRRLADPASRLWVVESRGRSVVGQIRFDLDAANHSATISLSVSAAARGIGVAGDLVRSACLRLQREVPSVSRVIAWIRPENQASLRTFASAGFGRVGIGCPDGVECARYEWTESSASMAARPEWHDAVA